MGMCLFKGFGVMIKEYDDVVDTENIILDSIDLLASNTQI